MLEQNSKAWHILTVSYRNELRITSTMEVTPPFPLLIQEGGYPSPYLKGRLGGVMNL
jgi:hypothetical protein